MEQQIAPMEMEAPLGAKGPGRSTPRALRAAVPLAVAALLAFAYLFTVVYGNENDMATVQAQLAQTQTALASVQAQMAQLSSDGSTVTAPLRRVPAEWEPQRAVWLQWPRHWEYDGNVGIYTAFENIITAIALYEDVHLIWHQENEGLPNWPAQSNPETGANFDQATLDRITFHSSGGAGGADTDGHPLGASNGAWATDNSWMRDNGPLYVVENGELTVQNWEFDAWGGGFGPLPYSNDNGIPGTVAMYAGLPVHHIPIVHEKGDLECNGIDSCVVSWSVLSQRNPQTSKSDMTDQLKEALGVQSIIYIEGFEEIDGTRGHVDGMVRFVGPNTLLVGQDGGELLDNVAAMIAEQRPDLTIDRMVAESAELFMNFLVGNGFIILGDSGDSAQNIYAQEKLQTHYPDRNVHFVDVSELWVNGGGIHCVTNDQPLL